MPDFLRMAKKIVRSFIDSLTARADVVSVINARVPLKRAGSNYNACCPFHDEKTPSFTVTPNKQFYHCFGCGASGGVVNFLMQYEHLSFVDAVEKLAEELGVPVEYEQFDEKRAQIKKDLHEILAHASELFQQNLLTDNANVARNYIKERGLNQPVLNQFCLGYSLKNNQLAQLWKSQPDVITEAKKAGLIAAGDYGDYDQFRDRLMFPIRDYRGRVLGFGARALGDAMPKYLNSGESDVFAKRYILYGLYELLQSTTKIEQIILVEGYMDVIALHQHGVLGAMAALGTALTAEHVKLARKYCQTIYLCFDGDKAGRNAANRAIQSILAGMELNDKIRVVFLPEGEDPDTLVRKVGQQGFMKLMQQGMLFSEFLYQHLIADSNMQYAEGKGEVYQRAKTLFDEMPDGPQKTLLYEGFVAHTGLDIYRLPTALHEQVVTKPNHFVNKVKKTNTVLRNQRMGIEQQLTRILLEYPQFAYFCQQTGVLLEKQSEEAILLCAVIELIQANGVDIALTEWLPAQLLQPLQILYKQPILELDIGKGEDNEARQQRLFDEFVKGYERLINEQLTKRMVHYPKMELN